MADTIVTIDRLQVRRSSTPGYRPGDNGSRPLADGEEFINFADGVRLIGDGTTPVVALPEYPLRPGIDDVPGLPDQLDNRLRLDVDQTMTELRRSRGRLNLGLGSAALFSTEALAAPGNPVGNALSGYGGRIGVLEQGTQSGQVLKSTWADLSALVPSTGNATGGQVLDTDTGTHTDPVATVTGTFTISIGNPALVTMPNHGLLPGARWIPSTDGALPTGITAGNTYYIATTGFGTNTVGISATPGGARIGTSGTQSGTHTATAGATVPNPGSYSYNDGSKPALPIGWQRLGPTGVSSKIDIAKGARVFGDYAAFAAAAVADVAGYAELRVNGARWFAAGTTAPGHTCFVRIGTVYYVLFVTPGAPVTPEMVGYSASGGIDCTPFLTKLQTHPLVSQISIGLGDYQIKNFRPRAGIAIQGVHRDVSRFTHDGDATISTSTNCMIYANAAGGNFSIDRVSLIGTPATVIGATVGPYYLLYIPRPGDTLGTRAGVKNINITNCLFYGGYNGCVVVGPDGFTIRDNRVMWQLVWGLAVTGACRNGKVVDNFIAFTGQEGLKRGDDENNFDMNVQVNRNTIYCCGSLDPNSMNDSFDQYIRNGERLEANDNTVLFASAGGIGTKFTADAPPVDDRNGHMDLSMRRNFVHMALPNRAMATQLTVRMPSSYGTLRRVGITDNDIVGDFTTHTVAITQMDTTAGSRALTYATGTTPHDLLPGDMVWLKAWGATGVGGIPATEILIPVSVHTVPSATTFTVNASVLATATATDTTGCLAWCWQRAIPVLAADPITVTAGSNVYRIATPRHSLSVGNHVELSGAGSVGGVPAEALAGRFVVSGVIDANTYQVTGSVPATTTATGGGSAVRARRIRIGVNALGIWVHHWADADVSDNRIDDMYTAIDVNPADYSGVSGYAAAVTDLIRNASIIDNIAHGVTNGVRLRRGTIEDLTLMRNEMEAQEAPLLTDSMVARIGNPRIKGNDFRNVGKAPGKPAAVLASLVGARIDGSNTFESRNGPGIVFNAPGGNGALTSDTVISGNGIKSAQEPLQAAAGAALANGITFNRNSLEAPANVRGWVDAGSGQVLAAVNHRGISAGVPDGAGAIGDCYDVPPVAGAASGYICTGASPAAATWKGVAAIAA